MKFSHRNTLFATCKEEFNPTTYDLWKTNQKLVCCQFFTQNESYFWEIKAAKQLSTLKVTSFPKVRVSCLWWASNTFSKYSSYFEHYHYRYQISELCHLRVLRPLLFICAVIGSFFFSRVNRVSFVPRPKSDLHIWDHDCNTDQRQNESLLKNWAESLLGLKPEPRRW